MILLGDTSSLLLSPSCVGGGRWVPLLMSQLWLLVRSRNGLTSHFALTIWRYVLARGILHARKVELVSSLPDYRRANSAKILEASWMTL